MKIIHIINSLGQGGAEGVLVRLCINDNKNKHFIITIMGASKYESILKENGIRVHNLNIKSFFNLFQFFTLIKILKKEKPDIMQTWLYHSDLIGGLAGALSGIKKIFWNIRHSDISSSNLKIRTKIIIRICAILSKYIPSGIIYCSRVSQQNHIHYGYSDANTILINNGFDINEFAPNNRVKNEIRGKYKLDSDKIVLGMIARFHPYKDHFTFIDALSQIKEKNYNFYCLLIGPEVTSSNLMLTNYVKKLDLQDDIFLLGPKDNISSYMNTIDLKILMTKSESFPNVIAESMACETPCISSDEGEARKIIGSTGWIIAENDPKILSSKIIEGINEWKNKLNWNKRKKLARERIIKFYSLEKMILAYENFWKK